MDRDLSLYKAAVLIASLDAETADLLLSQMPEHQADVVRNRVIRLGELNPREQQAVIAEFFHNGSLPQEDSRDADRNEFALQDELSVEDGADDEVDDGASDSCESDFPAFHHSTSFDPTQPNSQPFGFLHNTEPDLLISLLEREHPQAIALVLAHLPPAKSGHLLARLSASTQTEVVRRLVNLEEADPAILRDVEHTIESALKERHADRNRSAGMAAVTAILSASDHASRRQILHNLSVHDRPLAHQLTPPPAIRQFIFADVCRLSPSDFVRVIHAIDRRTAVLALAGAPPEMVDNIFDELPEEDAHWISQGLSSLGPLRLSDFDRAQTEMVNAAQQLHAAGHLPGLGPHHLTAVA
jgi:flagellar motor switch protein FliG